MDRLLQDSELMKTAFIGILFLLLGANAAAKRGFSFMALCLIGVLVCIVAAWFKVMSGV